MGNLFRTEAVEEPLNEYSAEICLELRTDKPIEHLGQISEQFLRAGLARTFAKAG